MSKRNKYEHPFSIKILDLEIGKRGFNALDALRYKQINYIGDLVQYTEAEILATPSFGRTSLNKIKHILVGMGLNFGMKQNEIYNKSSPVKKEINYTKEFRSIKDSIKDLPGVYRQLEYIQEILEMDQKVNHHNHKNMNRFLLKYIEEFIEFTDGLKSNGCELLNLLGKSSAINLDVESVSLIIKNYPEEASVILADHFHRILKRAGTDNCIRLISESLDD